MKAVQYFSDEYLASCQAMSLEERIEYLDQFRQMVGEVKDVETRSKSKLISIKFPEDLLSQLKVRAQREGLPYQTLIKKILRDSFR